MALRNFWVEVKIDGRKTDIAGGPISKDGGMTITTLQRKDGAKVEAVKVNCWESNGELYSRVEINGTDVGTFRTRR